MVEKKFNKQGQFKIQQMSFMLLAVILFFILVALLWISLQYKNMHEQATQSGQDRAVLISGFLSQSSEFSCSSELGSYCIDTDKIIILQNKTVYKEFWPVSYIKIVKIYPKEEEKKCNKANYPNCNIFNVFENKRIKSSSSISSFVALCRHGKVDDNLIGVCELGKLIIGYEIK